MLNFLIEVLYQVVLLLGVITFGILVTYLIFGGQIKISINNPQRYFKNVKIKTCTGNLLLKLKYLMIRLRYPESGFYTVLVLGKGFKMKEIDEWVKANELDFNECYTIHEKREVVCEDEVSKWED